MISCFQYIKDTKKKANHNALKRPPVANRAVSNTSKILKRKQITTQREQLQQTEVLFPIHQRY